MNAQEMWALYSEKNSLDVPFQAWSFGTEPDRLAELVLSGKKTATASAYVWYELENADLPKGGDHSVLLNAEDKAVCIIQTTKVSILPFDEVDEEHARKEGEGDGSLSDWRRTHEAFFRKEFENAGLLFHSKVKVLCEEFIRVFP